MKKLFLAVLVFVLLAFCVACSSDQGNVPNAETSVVTTELAETEAKTVFDIENYKSAAADLANKINENFIPVGNVANYQSNFFSTLGKVDADAAVEKGFDWLAEKSEYTREGVEALDSEIKTAYVDFVKIEYEGNEAQKISDGIDDLYNSYNSILGFITSPSGTPSSFAKSIQTLMKDYSDAYDTLSLFVEVDG